MIHTLICVATPGASEPNQLMELGTLGDLLVVDAEDLADILAELCGATSEGDRRDDDRWNSRHRGRI